MSKRVAGSIPLLLLLPLYVLLLPVTVAGLENEISLERSAFTVLPGEVTCPPTTIRVPDPSSGEETVRVLFATEDRFVYGFTATGERYLAVNVGYKAKALLVSNDGLVYAVNDRGRFTGITTTDGNVVTRGEFRVGDEPGYWDLDGAGNFRALYDRRVETYSIRGNLLWKTAFPAEVVSRRGTPDSGFLYLLRTGRILRVDNDAVGSVETSEVSFDEPETSALPIPETYQTPIYLTILDQFTVVAIYDNWLVEFYRADRPLLPFSTGEESNTEVRRPRSSADGSTALTTVADAVLSGTSVRERESLLASLDRRIDEGGLFGSLGAARSILLSIAQEVYRDPVYAGKTVVNDFPTLRLRAVRSLGRILDEPARQGLQDVAERDPDFRVVAAALESLSEYGYDPDSRLSSVALQRFSAADTAGRRFLAEPVAVVAAMYGSGNVGDEILAALIEAPISREQRENALNLFRLRREARW